MLHSLKKIKKNSCRCHCQNLDDMIYNSWDIEQTILKLVILGHFLPFYPLKTPKIKILKIEKIYWRYHHFTCVPKITIIWCIAPEIWSVTGRIFCHYGPVFALLPPPLSPHPMDPEIQNFEKKKKASWRYYHFTNVYHKWHSYICSNLRVAQDRRFIVEPAYIRSSTPWCSLGGKFWISDSLKAQKMNSPEPFALPKLSLESWI